MWYIASLHSIDSASCIYWLQHLRPWLSGDLVNDIPRHARP